MPTSQRPLARRHHPATPRIASRARLALLAASMLTVAGCAQMATSPEPAPRSAAQTQVDQAIEANDPTALARARMALSKTLSGKPRAEQQLAALETAIDAHQLDLARQLYQQTDTRSLWKAIDPRRAAIARGLGQWSNGDRAGALRTIHRIPLPLANDVQGRRLLLLGALQADAGRPLTAARYYVAVDDLLPLGKREANHARLWNLLVEVPADRLRQAKSNATDPRFADWLDLALTYRQQPGQMDSWVAAHPEHPAVKSGFVEMLGSSGSLDNLRAPADQGPVAVLLPEAERYATISREIRQGLQFAADNGAIPGRELLFLDSGTGALGARAAIEQARQAGAALIVGPLLKQQIPALGALGADGPLAIALNAPADGTSLPRGAVSFSLSPEQDARAAAHRMWADGYRRVAIFSADQQLGERTSRAFTQAFTLLGGEVVDQASFAPGQTDFSNELNRLLQVEDEGEAEGDGKDGPFQPVIRDDLDAIFLAANGEELALIVPQLDYFGAEELPRYGLGLAYSGSVDRRGDDDKDGVIIPVAPMLLAGTAGPEAPLRMTFERAQLAGPLPRLFAFGVDAGRIAGHMDGLLQGGTLDGLTGELSLTPTGVIEREPSWGQFQDGLLQPVAPSPVLPADLTSPAEAAKPTGGPAQRMPTPADAL